MRLKRLLWHLAAPERRESRRGGLGWPLPGLPEWVSPARPDREDPPEDGREDGPEGPPEAGPAPLDNLLRNMLPQSGAVPRV